MPVRPDPSSLRVIVTRAEALAAGLTDDEVRQRVRGGSWVRLDTGVYLRSGKAALARGVLDDDHAAARLAHVQRCGAAVLRHRGCVIGFGSAALVHGLPLVSGIPPLGQLIVPPGGWTGRRAGVRYRSARLADGDVHPTLPCTSAARTWADVAREHSLADALACGDAALRAGLLSPATAALQVAGMDGVRGCRQARAAVQHLDARRESALESFSWARMVEWRLPLPELQHEVWDPTGLVGRVDFWWEHRALVGEADGRGKYRTPDDLYAEKRREDRLRAQGLSVIRWDWSDLTGRRAERLRARLTAALT